MSDSHDLLHANISVNLPQDRRLDQLAALTRTTTAIVGVATADRYDIGGYLISFALGHLR